MKRNYGKYLRAYYYCLFLLFWGVVFPCLIQAQPRDSSGFTHYSTQPAQQTRSQQRPAWMSFILKTYLVALQAKPTLQDVAALEPWMANGCDTSRVIVWLDSLLHTKRWQEAVFNRSWQERLTHAGDERLKNFESSLAQEIQQQKDPLAKLKLEQALKHTQATLQARSRFLKGEMDYLQLQQVLSLNPVYDDIHMGAQAFVYSFFLYFLERLPTKVEEDQASLMFEGFPTIFWGQQGGNKEDVVKIFFDHPAVAEGIVRKLYTQIFGKRPEPNRLAQLTAEYVQTRNLRLVYYKCLFELYTQTVCGANMF